MKRLIQSLYEISTKPNQFSLKWNGKRSLLTSILLWAIWVFRLFSILQISKFIYRKIIKKLGKDNTDLGSRRINVPPLFVEIYFIIWAIVLLCGYFMGLNHKIFSVLAYYYLFESFVWIVYYTIFRRFFEENYTLYHVLEYFVDLIIIIPTQGIALSIIFDIGFLDVLSGLVGADSINGVQTPLAISLLGALYSAIVIGMIISNFPIEGSKTSLPVPNNVIIGFGDVVKNRLLPAIVKQTLKKADFGDIHKQRRFLAKSIKIYDIVESDHSDSYNLQVCSPDEIVSAMHTSLSSRSIVWIETPSFNHIFYLKELLELTGDNQVKIRPGLIVLEKPVTCNREELKEIKQWLDCDGFREKVFFLSYYLLEKGLPLYYLYLPQREFEKYLQITDKTTLSYMSYLGDILSLDVSIMEGEDNREWTFAAENGGQFAETFIHNLLIASLVCGLPQNWNNVELKNKNDENGSIIELSAISGKTQINLKQGKNVAPMDRLRKAVVKYENGYVICDFDKEIVELYIEKINRKCEISIKKSFKDKYSVQVDLVNRVFLKEIDSSAVDGLFNQIEILEWILNEAKGLKTS